MESEKRIGNLPQIVGRALDILEALVDSNVGLGITELGGKVGLNKSTTYRIVQALKIRDYVNQNNQTNKYYLGYKILTLANGFSNQNRLRDVARKHLEELSKKTSHTVQLAILEKKEVIYLDQVEGSYIFQLRLQIGNRAPFHCTAAGKSILAFLKQEELEDILNHADLVPFCNKTITSIGVLRKELKTIKRNGFSFCDGEYDNYLRAIGAPIMGIGPKVIGCVVLTAPSNCIKLREVPYFSKIVKETGLKISSEVGG